MPRLDVYPGFITKKTSFNPFMDVRCISEAELSEATRSEATRSEATRSEATRSEATRSEATRSEATRSEVKSNVEYTPLQKVVKDPFFQMPEAKEKDPFSFEMPDVKDRVKDKKPFFLQKSQQPKLVQSEKVTRPMSFDQPRGKDGERLLYTYPNLPIISLDPLTEYTVLVGSSDKSSTAWLMQFDGAANPNPGPASSGAILWSPKDASGYRSPVFEMGKFLGKATNNLAEIQGLLLGLKMAAARGARELLIEGDSELIIRQQTREYKVSNKNLKSWWAEIQAAMMDEISFDWIAIRHVRREFNERADSITKEVLSKREGFTRCG
jgi:ribonuclease HI